jgi:hypothetical protein
MAHPPSTTQASWEPSARDALNLATLRYYALNIESLIILAYRSDPDPTRPRLAALKQLLVKQMKELRALGDARSERTQNGDCPDPEDTRCEDGFCYPPPGCPS